MRWLVRSVFALVMLAFLALAALFVVPTERIARLATERFSEITGRSLQIEGAVRPSLWPTLGVKASNVSISNADWSENPTMLRADALDIALDMAALWAGEVKVTGLRAIRPEIVLEKAADGRANWVFGGINGGSASAGMPGEGTPFTLDLAEVADGRFRFIDHAAGTDLTLEEVNGSVRIPSFEGEAKVSLAAQRNGQDFDLSLTIAEFAPFLQGSPVALDLRLRAGPAEVSFAGRGGHAPMAARGQINADFGDMSALSAVLGMDRPSLPAGLGASSVAISGDLTVTDGGINLRAGAVGLDGNQLSLEADLTFPPERPRLSARVSTQAFRLAQPAAGQGGSGAATSRDAGWSTDVIDVSGLGALDATVAVSAEAIDLGAMRLGPTRAVITLDRARAVFDLRQIAAYDGVVSGQFVVNGRNGLSVGGDLRLADLSMEPLLTDLAGYDRLIARGSVAAQFLAVGNSLDALMRSLSGSGQFSLGRGEIRGLDIAGMLQRLDADFVGEGQKTIFDSLSASFVIRDGVLQNDDLALAAPYLTAKGAGSVDVGGRQIDYRLRPTAMASADGTGGVMVPLLISGSWAAPKFRLDLESLAKERLEEERKALEERARAEAKEAEARARAEIERKAQEELGIVRQEGESLEDAARRRAQEALDAEAGKLINRLLGGN